MDVRQKIMEGTLEAFNQKGMKFTMDDLAKQLGMSKKTIYHVFQDKEALFLATVDHVFDSIKESEQAVLAEEGLTTLERLRKILGVLPERYLEIDFRQMYSLKEKFPKIYQQVEKRLETGWETTISLLDQGMEEGVIRRISIPIFKLIFEATLEQFFQRDVLVQNHISYTEALDQVAEILIDGIRA